MVLFIYCRFWFEKEAEEYLVPRIPDVEYVLENTIHGSQLPRFVVAYYIWHINLDWYQGKGVHNLLETIPELSTELLIALSSRVLSSKDPFEDPSSFHKYVKNRPAPPA